MIVAVAANSLWLSTAGLMLSALAFNNVFYMSFSFISETVAESHRDKFSLLIEFFYGLGIALNTLWFYLFGDWRVALTVGYGLPAAIATAGAVFLIKDTPMNMVTRQ